MRRATGQFLSIVEPALAHVEDRQARDAVWSAFQSASSSLVEIEECFRLFTSRAWSREALYRFFYNWRNPLCTAGTASGFDLRIARLADGAEADARYAYLLSAAALSMIVSDDTGATGASCRDLYSRLATTACGDKIWQSSAYRVHGLEEFQEWGRQQYLEPRDIEDGISVTIAITIYNYGEFTMVTPMFENWAQEILGLSPRESRSNLAFLAVHTGAVDLHYFMHALDAQAHYCRAKGTPIDYDHIHQRCAAYFHRRGEIYKAIEDALLRASARASSIAP